DTRTTDSMAESCSQRGRTRRWRRRCAVAVRVRRLGGGGGRSRGEGATMLFLLTLQCSHRGRRDDANHHGTGRGARNDRCAPAHAVPATRGVGVGTTAAGVAACAVCCAAPIAAVAAGAVFAPVAGVAGVTALAITVAQRRRDDEAPERSAPMPPVANDSRTMRQL